MKGIALKQPWFMLWTTGYQTWSTSVQPSLASYNNLFNIHNLYYQLRLNTFSEKTEDVELFKAYIIMQLKNVTWLFLVLCAKVEWRICQRCRLHVFKKQGTLPAEINRDLADKDGKVNEGFIVSKVWNHKPYYQFIWSSWEYEHLLMAQCQANSPSHPIDMKNILTFFPFFPWPLERANLSSQQSCLWFPVLACFLFVLTRPVTVKCLFQSFTVGK